MAQISPQGQRDGWFVPAGDISFRSSGIVQLWSLAVPAKYGRAHLKPGACGFVVDVLMWFGHHSLFLQIPESELDRIFRIRADDRRYPLEEEIAPQFADFAISGLPKEILPLSESYSRRMDMAPPVSAWRKAGPFGRNGFHTQNRFRRCQKQHVAERAI